MHTIATRFPLLFTLSFFLLAGIVYAQVVPEEEVLPVEPEPTPIEEVVPEEAVATSSEVTIAPDSATTTASSSDPVEEVVATSTDVATEEVSVPSAPVTDTPMNPLMEENFSPSAKADFSVPRHCQSPAVEDFFENSRECVKYVIDTNARERYEAAGLPLPERFEEE